MLLPLLGGKGDIAGIIGSLSGAKRDSSYDGLTAMRNAQSADFAKRYRMGPTSGVVSRAAESFLDTLGVNPYTGAGQGASQIIASLYKIFPDIVGGMIGVKSPQDMYQNIVNGAGGISMAYGMGMPNVFNPYSMRNAREFALARANDVYRMAMKEDGGYNIDYTHGLSMSDVGKISQRILSSGIAYRDESGRSLDLDNSEDAEKFRSNLKELGEKFNGVASMLSKITGSVDEAIEVMDRMSSSGSFLGESARDADAIARRARNISAMARATAAAAGMDPKEVYAMSKAMGNDIYSRYGVSSALGESTPGFSGVVYQQSMVGSLAYSMWSAQNPGASKLQQSAAAAGIQRRVSSYSGSSGENLASIVAANRDRFTDSEISEIERSYREGRPNDILDLVRNRIGSSAFNYMMSDSAEIQAARLKASESEGGRDVLTRMFRAGVEGNAHEASMAGAKRGYDLMMRRMDDDIADVTGDGRRRSLDRREDARQALITLAVRKGYKEQDIAGMDERGLRGMLSATMDTRDIEDVVRTSGVKRQIDEIKSLRMNDEDDNAAENRFFDIVRSRIDEGSEAYKKWSSKFYDESGDKNAVVREFMHKHVSDPVERQRLMMNVTGGKYFASSADKKISELESEREKWSGVSMDAIVGNINAIAKGGLVLGKNSMASVIGTKDYEGAETDAKAQELYEKALNEKVAAGQISADAASGYRDRAVNWLVEDVLDGGIGSVNSKSKEYSEIVNILSRSINKSDDIKSGFSKGLERVKSLYGDVIGEDGLKQIDSWIKGENTGKFDLLNRKELGSRQTQVINERMDADVEADSKMLMSAYNNTDEAEAVRGFIDVSKRLVDSKTLSGDPTSALRGGIEDELGAILSGEQFRGVNLKDIAGGVDLEGGDIAKSISDKLREAGHVDAADIVGGASGLRNRVFARALKRMGANARGVSAYDIARTASNANDATSGYNAAMISDGVFDASAITDENAGDIANHISNLDKEEADRKSNAFQNALNYGTGSFAKSEIDSARKRINDIKKVLNVGERGGISKDDLAGFVGGDSEATKAISEKLEKGGINVGESLELLRSYAGAKFNVNGKEVSGSDVLGSKSVDISNVGSDKEVLGVVKNSNKDETFRNMEAVAKGIDILSNCVSGGAVKVILGAASSVMS